MSLGYDPDSMEEGGGKAEAGTYPFKVDEFAEVTFKNGSSGVRAVLMVGAFKDNDIKVFENFSYKPQALWKLKQLFDAIGIDFSSRPAAHEAVNKTGLAKFAVGEKGYLEVDEFIAAGANNAPGSDHDYGPPPMDTEDVPF